MDMIRSTLQVALGAAILMSASSFAHQNYGHSLEEDQHDERAEGPRARIDAERRVTWRDRNWNRDPVVRLKLLGINDFHGQLSPRLVGNRFAGGAAVLASYLESASAAAQDGAIIIHAGDHVGASPP